MIVGRAITQVRSRYYRLRHRRRATFGPRVFFAAPMKLHGRGQIVFGADVFVDNKSGVRNDIYAAEGATVSVGDNTYLNGVTIWATQDVRLGKRCIVGGAWISTTNFHGTGIDRSANVKEAAVTVGDNVWLANHAAVLPGVTIGADSVVAFGTVIAHDVPPRVVIAGQVPRVVREIDHDSRQIDRQEAR